ncbi:MAG: hypothetical protein J07HQW2_03082 [Haloquadratum walsbyi J07HQW2]|uniref:Uncharacterized protein n=1 Tax=Haloquadratum walsbyi J07HQW2 TaxID=1238425 RepID=U1PS41_9EURY|nr:MAG: hypothetical protein J07HQW2_03082 [Haloquadratum walsbyi J07HQW2]
MITVDEVRVLTAPGAGEAVRNRIDTPLERILTLLARE